MSLLETKLDDLGATPIDMVRAQLTWIALENPERSGGSALIQAWLRYNSVPLDYVNDPDAQAVLDRHLDDDVLRLLDDVWETVSGDQAVWFDAARWLTGFHFAGWHPDEGRRLDDVVRDGE